MSEDKAKLFRSLRASTKLLLGFADDPLTAAQEIRLDRAISMRLIVDDALARQLAGEEIDVRAFTTASEALERLTGSDPGVSTSERRFGPSAKEKLRIQLEAILSDESREREMAHDPIAARAKFEAELAAACKKFGQDGEIFPLTDKHDAGDSVDGGAVPPNVLSDAPNKALPPPAPVSTAGTASASPEQRRERVDALNAMPSNPPGFTRNEPWRGFVPEYEDGGLLGGGSNSPWGRR